MVTKSLLLECIPQTPLVLAGTYDMHNSVSHGRNKNSDARSHDRNLVSANSSFQRFLGSYLNCDATCDGAMEEK